MKNILTFEEMMLEGLTKGQKKLPEAMQKAILKKQGKEGKDDDDDDDEKEEKKKKKDDDKDDDDDKPKGLSAKQKKLPEHLQKAILKRMKK